MKGPYFIRPTGIFSVARWPIRACAYAHKAGHSHRAGRLNVKAILRILPEELALGEVPKQHVKTFCLEIINKKLHYDNSKQKQK